RDPGSGAGAVHLPFRPAGFPAVSWQRVGSTSWGSSCERTPISARTPSGSLDLEDRTKREWTLQSRSAPCLLGCHGLVPWSLTLVSTASRALLPGCHGLVPWFLTLVSTASRALLPGCHGLVPWRFTFLSTDSSLSKKRESPRHKAVASMNPRSWRCRNEREGPRRKAVASQARTVANTSTGIIDYLHQYSARRR